MLLHIRSFINVFDSISIFQGKGPMKTYWLLDVDRNREVGSHRNVGKLSTHK